MIPIDPITGPTTGGDTMEKDATRNQTEGGRLADELYRKDPWACYEDDAEACAEAPEPEEPCCCECCC